MKAGDVLVRIAQLELVNDVVPDAPRGAGRERRDRAIRENERAGSSTAGSRAGTRVPTPRCSAPRQWRKSDIGTRCSQPSVSARASRSGERYSSRNSPSRACAHDCGLLARSSANYSATPAGIPICASCATWSCISAISGEITTAVCARQHRGRQLVAQRFAAARRHDHASVVPAQQAAHNAFLQRTKRVVAPIAPQGGDKLRIRVHGNRSIRLPPKSRSALNLPAGRTFCPRFEPLPSGTAESARIIPMAITPR